MVIRFCRASKQKPVPRFQEECLQMIEEGGLEIRLAIPGPFGELREFKNVRIVAIEACGWPLFFGF